MYLVPAMDCAAVAGEGEMAHLHWTLQVIGIDLRSGRKNEGSGMIWEYYRCRLFQKSLITCSQVYKVEIIFVLAVH